jgi:peptidylprolyl isomerase
MHSSEWSTMWAIPLHLPNPPNSGKTPAFDPFNENPMSNDELQVTDIRLGDGKAVVKGALITTQYTGTLEDGTVFDSSWERGKPFQCVIGTGRVIKGWDQGLMGMQVGGVRTLYVPAHLAYGERSMGAHIKPNSNLRFEIELLEVLTRDD